MKTWIAGQQPRADRPRISRYVAAAALITLVLADAGCSAQSQPTPGNTSPATLSTPSAPVATDAAGDPIIRPRCAEPGDGEYQHAAGPTLLTPVLVLGQGPRGVVVGAQANGGICQVLPFGRELVSKGYHVAVFDWTRPYNEAMVAATQALIAAGATKVVLGGFSRGALVGLGVAPSLGSQIAGVFSVSGGPSAEEGFDTVASVSAYSGPILLVGSVDDPLFPKATTDAIAAAHIGPETVLTVPGSGHALALLRGPDGARVRAALDEFLAEVLP
jgi:pimeloyl-ACP methyl ester carboxylesterase